MPLDFLFFRSQGEVPSQSSASEITWFHGENSLGLPLADIESGGCCDGLTAAGVNRNQGAESTLAYLWTELLNTNVQNSCSESRSTTGAFK